MPRPTCALLTIALLLALPRAVPAQGTLEQARTLYEAAAYDEALAILAKLPDADDLAPSDTGICARSRCSVKTRPSSKSTPCCWRIPRTVRIRRACRRAHASRLKRCASPASADGSTRRRPASTPAKIAL